jgi:hypothetical protein
VFPNSSTFLAAWDGTISRAGNHVLKETLGGATIAFLEAVASSIITTMGGMIQLDQLVSSLVEIQWIQDIFVKFRHHTLAHDGAFLLPIRLVGL